MKDLRNLIRLFRGALGGWLVVGWATVAVAAVKLPAVIGDNMVLQRGQPLPIWGRADQGEEVTVRLAGQTLTTKAGADGRWQVVLQKLDVGQPRTMIIHGSSGSSITLTNILVGEVWICAGQSNMELGIGACLNATAEIAAANYPQIRLLMMAPHCGGSQPAADVPEAWAPCTPQTVAANGCSGFSAAGYYFGRQLHQTLNVPVGLIDTSVGGTAAELWIRQAALAANPALQPLTQGACGYLYQSMITPLIPYAIRGAIWYQGEANGARGYQYRTLFPALIANWRADWGQGDFPFGFVQLPPFRQGGEIDPTLWAELREAQLLTWQSVTNTGMAVTMDIGDVNDVHPKNKQDVGQRLALWALAQIYGRDIVYSGPIYQSMTVAGHAIRLRFEHVGGGLIAADGQALTEFTMAGADQKFAPAVAEIDGNSVIVHSDQVRQPVAVRYAWRNDATPNLANREGLPASPFRTDTWQGVTQP
jgi:sialate O-acetylesterase